MTASLCMRAVEFRSEGGVGDGRTLEGHAAVFSQPTLICSWEGEFLEEIVPGAFRKTLRQRTPVLQFDHGRDPRTGTVPIGTFTSIAEDDAGLAITGRLFDNPTVEPIRQAIAGGAITGMSIRFQVTKETWTDVNGDPVKAGELADLLWAPGDRGPLKRAITEIDPLSEAGPVVFPAYTTTDVGVRSLLAQVTPDERRWLLAQLVRDIPDLTGRPAADAGGGDRNTDSPPETGQPSQIPSARVRALHRTLRLEGIIP